MTVRLLKRELLQQGLGQSSSDGSSSATGSSTALRIPPAMLRVFERSAELQVSWSLWQGWCSRRGWAHSALSRDCQACVTFT